MPWAIVGNKNNNAPLTINLKAKKKANNNKKKTILTQEFLLLSYQSLSLTLSTNVSPCLPFIHYMIAGYFRADGVPRHLHWPWAKMDPHYLQMM